VEVKAGAVLAGSREAGFWAVWQEEADRARTASIAIHTWSFVTRIFFYKIRIALWIKARSILSKIVPRGPPRVNAEKEPLRLLPAPDRLVTHGITTQTAEAGQKFEPGQSPAFGPQPTGRVRPASSPDARFGSLSLCLPLTAFPRLHAPPVWVPPHPRRSAAR
jgi:hypothetical protein